MPAEHDGDFGSVDSILADGGIAVEHDPKRVFWVLYIGDGAGDQVSESVDREQFPAAKEEVHDHYRDRGGERQWGDVGDFVKIDAGDGGDYVGKVFFDKEVARTCAVYLDLCLE